MKPTAPSMRFGGLFRVHVDGDTASNIMLTLPILFGYRCLRALVAGPLLDAYTKSSPRKRLLGIVDIEQTDHVVVRRI